MLSKIKDKFIGAKDLPLRWKLNIEVPNCRSTNNLFGMVSKKLLKNKVPFSNNRKSNESEEKRAIFVSQKVIIESIFDKSLIDPTIQVRLPDNIAQIYKDMISDASYINETLKNKDYSFYNCNMGFINSEEMISSKRKALVEFMMKKENSKKTHKLTRNYKKKKSIIKTKNESVKNLQGMEKSENDKDSELSSENNFTIRPKRKRNRPSKFKSENSAKKKKENSVKEELKVGEEIIKIQVCDEKLKKFRKEKSEIHEVIDLIEDNSSDGGEQTNKKALTVNLGSSLSSQIVNKSKVYFREPLTRRPTKLVNKHLKEHTLLDKILLGINCVRKWTEKGLHLSRLCETDLALLNKRLTSLNCILTDLQEHTDENNNRYLSVLLKSDLFSSFILTGQKPCETVVQDDSSISVPIVNNSNEQQEIVENLSYNRPKSKLHVPSMYRQRHGLPGILSKPPVKLNDSIKLNFNESPVNSSQKPEEIPFSLANSEEKSTNVPAIVTNSNPVSMVTASATSDIVAANEPQMTASKLLKIKSQKFINQANQNRTVSATTEMPSLIKPCSTPSPRLHVMSNGIVSDKNQTFFYQTTNLPQKVPFPMYLLSNGTLLSAAPNSTIHRQTRVSMPKTIHTITRIPLQNNTQNSPLNFYQSKMSQNPKTATNLTSKSVVLKNLLQQSNSAQIISSHPVSTNQMVPLSVFQNSQNKRPFFPVNQYSFHK